MVFAALQHNICPGFREEQTEGPNPWPEQHSSSPPWPPSWPPSAPPASPSTRATSTACRGRPRSTDPGRHGTTRHHRNTALNLFAAAKTLVGGRTALAGGAATGPLGALPLAN